MEYGIKRNENYDYQKAELDEIDQLEKENGIAVFSDLECELWNEMVKALNREDI